MNIDIHNDHNLFYEFGDLLLLAIAILVPLVALRVFLG